ncbi:hypothetical protein HDU76_013305 [Blyttiomyces sp. JEL0837]|nr:hypothetical protein HDU76_013305 [Blyttiomyces sp. JEL0837]
MTALATNYLDQLHTHLINAEDLARQTFCEIGNDFDNINPSTLTHQDLDLIYAIIERIQPFQRNLLQISSTLQGLNDKCEIIRDGIAPRLENVVPVTPPPDDDMDLDLDLDVDGTGGQNEVPQANLISKYEPVLSFNLADDNSEFESDSESESEAPVQGEARDLQAAAGQVSVRDSDVESEDDGDSEGDSDYVESDVESSIDLEAESVGDSEEESERESEEEESEVESEIDLEAESVGDSEQVESVGDGDSEIASNQGLNIDDSTYDNMGDFDLQEDEEDYEADLDHPLPASRNAVEELRRVAAIGPKLLEEVRVGNSGTLPRFLAIVCNQDCPICFSAPGYGDRLQMPCGHIFHEPCLRIWLGQQNTCPTCRYQIPTNNEQRNLNIAQAMEGRVRFNFSEAFQPQHSEEIDIQPLNANGKRARVPSDDVSIEHPSKFVRRW